MGLFESDEITLILDKYSFKPGDTIAGVVNLNLKKAIKARKLEVALIGKIKITQRASNGAIRIEERNVYDFTLPLDGEKEYLNGQYPFEIKIPQDILKPNLLSRQFQEELESQLGTIGSIIGQFANEQRPIQWMIHAHLDIPWKLDIKKSRDVVISQESMPYSNNI